MKEEKTSTTAGWILALFIGMIGSCMVVIWWVQPVFELLGSIEPKVSHEHKALFIFIGVITLAIAIGYWDIFFHSLKNRQKTK